MADKYMRFVVTFQPTSNIPQDRMVNVWHWLRDDTLPGTDFDNVRDMLQDFYQTATFEPPSSLIKATALVQAYDLETESPRIPSYESSLTVIPSSQPALPSEVAIVCSFQGDREAGKPQSRRRGRVFLGPWATSANTQGRPTGAVMSAIAAAGKEMIDAQQLFRWSWCVYSPTTAARESLPEAFVQVTNGWIDNAFDTQRRRGLKDTSRMLFEATP